MDCIKQLSTRQLVHSRIVSLYFVSRFLTGQITGQGVPSGAQFPLLPEEISKAESLLDYFESHEEALLDLVRQRRDASAQWHKYVSRYDLLVRNLFEASVRIKSELC